MESTEGFFSEERTRRAIQTFLANLKELQATDQFEQERNKHISLILNNMFRNAGQWESYSSVNIGWIGRHFVSDLLDEKATQSKEAIDDIYAICYRFLLELYLTMKSDLALEYEEARRFATQNLECFSANARRQIEFATKDMPIGILKSLINHENIESIINFNSTIENAKNLKKDWDNELELKLKEVEQLKNNLEQYKSAFNFVGLFQGFDDLSTEKKAEKRSLLWCLNGLGMLVILPVAFEITYILSNIEKLDQLKGSLIILLMPTLSLMAILIYYFRILLMNFNSVKSQLLQLELRKTLCRFIQNYVDYSTEIKKKDKESLAKFENVVFSGLVMSDEKLPSTFDGIDQLAALIKSVKSG
ncbi:hypothetical protein [Geotalea sp. SG265]|uniref:hypothetical protein n=1 Tax=Geotalea sp. SG265 TaxID=2922867 RepID=UPI001FAEDCC4|nr:hypothetical protein [Geotalea sp. SG265]